MRFVTAILFLIFWCTQSMAEEVLTLQNLEHLVGTWKLIDPKDEKERAFRLTYKLISKNTALVEVYGDPSRQTTETIFHMDGPILMATHYCGRGNQPRLKAVKDNESDQLVFEFLDVTNLLNQDDPHMVGMRYRFIDNNNISKQEVYRVKGKEYPSMMRLVRE